MDRMIDSVLPERAVISGVANQIGIAGNGKVFFTARVHLRLRKKDGKIVESWIIVRRKRINVRRHPEGHWNMERGRHLFHRHDCSLQGCA